MQRLKLSQNKKVEAEWVGARVMCLLPGQFNKMGQSRELSGGRMSKENNILTP